MEEAPPEEGMEKVRRKGAERVIKAWGSGRGRLRETKMTEWKVEGN